MVKVWILRDIIDTHWLGVFVFEKTLNKENNEDCNFDKNGIKNYIGGNTLMEIGFAHVNDKKVFLLNPIPEEVPYVDEIKAMTDLVIEGDLQRIKL